MSLLDILFPPICRICRERSSSLLCLECWELILPPDPASRCRHCFKEIESKNRMCSQCARSPYLESPRAYLFDRASPIIGNWRSLLMQEGEGAFLETVASLFLLQWEKLEWPIPDRLAIVPSFGQTKLMRAIGEKISEMLGLPMKKELKLSWENLCEWRIKRSSEDLLEGCSLLLIDFASSDERIKNALDELWQAYPKQIHLLSLFEGSLTI